jgi:hypothetical protein
MLRLTCGLCCSFEEPPLGFAPTFKFNLWSKAYDTSRKQVIWKCDLKVWFESVTWKCDLKVWLESVTWKCDLKVWLESVTWNCMFITLHKEACRITPQNQTQGGCLNQHQRILTNTHASHVSLCPEYSNPHRSKLREASTWEKQHNSTRTCLAPKIVAYTHTIHSIHTCQCAWCWA